MFCLVSYNTSFRGLNESHDVLYLGEGVDSIFLYGGYSLRYVKTVLVYDAVSIVDGLYGFIAERPAAQSNNVQTGINHRMASAYNVGRDILAAT